MLPFYYCSATNFCFFSGFFDVLKKVSALKFTTAKSPPLRTCVFFAPKTLSASYEQNPCAGKTVKISKFPDVSPNFFSAPGKFSKYSEHPMGYSKRALL